MSSCAVVQRKEYKGSMQIIRQETKIISFIDALIFWIIIIWFSEQETYTLVMSNSPIAAIQLSTTITLVKYYIFMQSDKKHQNDIYLYRFALGGNTTVSLTILYPLFYEPTDGLLLLNLFGAEMSIQHFFIDSNFFLVVQHFFIQDTLTSCYKYAESTILMTYNISASLVIESHKNHTYFCGEKTGNVLANLRLLNIKLMIGYHPIKPKDTKAQNLVILYTLKLTTNASIPQSLILSTN
ncbi:hypothetical protein ACJX0J_023180, partial [Zea mays]